MCFGDRISSKVTFLLQDDVLLPLLMLFRILLRRMPLIGWHCDDLGEDVGLPAQLTSNQVTLPENEEAEVFAMIPAIANREGCLKSRFRTGYLHLKEVTLDQPLFMLFRIISSEEDLHFGRVGMNCHC